MNDARSAQSFEHKTPPGDDKLRRVCQTCGFIDYVNPKIVTGSVVHRDRQVLLCRRAIEPRRGFWTLPAGFMEVDESLEEAAKREAREEAMAELELQGLLAIYSIPRISQVQVFFRAKLLGPVAPGPESLEVALFDWDAIPWAEVAFPTARWALEHYHATKEMSVILPQSNPPGTDHLTRGRRLPTD